MLAIGILRQDEQSKTYHIGAGMFALARAAVDEAELVHIARPSLERLASESGESSYLGVLVPEGVVTIDRHEGAFNIHSIGRIGNTFPAHATAMGKAILAALPEKRLSAYLETHGLAGYTAKTIIDRDRFREELARARENGFAYGDTEFNEDLRSVAAPAFDFTGRVVGGIGIVGPIWRIKSENLSTLSEVVKAVALDFSRRLGAEGEVRDALAVTRQTD